MLSCDSWPPRSQSKHYMRWRCLQPGLNVVSCTLSPRYQKMQCTELAGQLQLH